MNQYMYTKQETHKPYYSNLQFGRPLLGHHYYILSFSDPCPVVEKNIFKEKNAFSLYDLYGHALAQQPLSRGA